MAFFYTKQFNKPDFTSRYNQILNFMAGEEIPAKAYVKRSALDFNTVFVWDGTGSPTGYNLSRKAVPAGCRLDVVIDGYDLEEITGGGDSDEINQVEIPPGETRVVHSLNKITFTSADILLRLIDLTTNNIKTMKIIADWNTLTTRDSVYGRIGRQVTAVVFTDLSATDFQLNVTNTGINTLLSRSQIETKT